MPYSNLIKCLRMSLALLLLSGGANVRADGVVDLVHQANLAFKTNDLAAALELYKEAESQIPKSPELTYNIASVLHEQGKYEEAIDLFEETFNDIDPSYESSARYNLGNSYYRSGDYIKAIESYQNVLGLDPDDMDAKFNLELSRKMLKENSKAEQSENQEQQQQQQQEKKEQEEEKDEQDKQNKDENGNKENQDDQNQQQDQNKDQQKKQQEADDKKMSKEDAARILNALRDDELKQQKKARQAKRIQITDPDAEDW